MLRRMAIRSSRRPVPSVANVNDPVTGEVLITGRLAQGGTLGFDASGLEDLDGDVTVTGQQWLRNGEVIAGATGETYTLTQADVDPEDLGSCYGEWRAEDLGGDWAYRGGE